MVKVTINGKEIDVEKVTLPEEVLKVLVEIIDK